jgi:hypothetical protein
MDPYKEEQKRNPSNGYEILEKYLKEKERNRIRNKIFREVWFQNLLTELEYK